MDINTVQKLTVGCPDKCLIINIGGTSTDTRFPAVYTKKDGIAEVHNEYYKCETCEQYWTVTTRKDGAEFIQRG